MINEDLTQSGNVGVRWQAQMEMHLATVRRLSMRRGKINAMRAQAHATAAVALAVALTGGDLELAVTRLRDDA